MDNRRAIHSYRQKQAAARGETPYARPAGLFSKMKLYLTPASLWSRLPPSEEPRPPPCPPQEAAAAAPAVASAAPELQTPLKTRSSLAAGLTPNHVLTSFFEAKGDQPLTEVEYEGVVALLAKLRQATPRAAKAAPLHSTDANTTAADANTTAADATTTATDANASLAVATPTQRVLHNDSAVFSTPEYRPTYHTVRGGTTTYSIPSVKRVYQFLGLPSPYRTRVRTPNLSAKKRKPPPAAETPEETRPAKLSSTANTLLSILDGGSEGETENDIKAISSPFVRKRARAAGTEAKRLTPADIEKTILFDQSAQLPQAPAEPEVKLEAKPEVKLEAKLEAKPAESQEPQHPQEPQSSQAPAPTEPAVAPAATAPAAAPLVAAAAAAAPAAPSSSPTRIFFPEISQTPAQLDPSKVAAYKALFDFS